MWIVGDEFLAQSYSVLQQQDSESVVKRRRRPYIYEMYNIQALYNSNNFQYEKAAVGRMVNSMIKGLNAAAYLPKYILFVPDLDIITSANFYAFGNGIVLEAAVHWMVKEIKRLLMARRENPEECETWHTITVKGT